MILRRFTEALRRQDWTTIGVELVMVVLGIFLGIEAANWNEDRRDRQDESAYLLRLHEDVRSSIEDLNRGRDDVASWNEQGQRALRALQEGDPSLAGEDAAHAFAASTRIGLPVTQLATITELISSGGLNEISDPDIRAALARMDGSIQGLREHIRILVDYVVPVAPTVQTRLRPDFGGGTGMDRNVSFDFDALSADEEFQNALGYVLRIQRWNLLWMGAMIRELEDFEALLAEKLGEADPEPAPAG
ncbi:MAG: hypothetical protein P8008_07710 [Gammaproteobacteria bacterium]